MNNSNEENKEVEEVKETADQTVENEVKADSVEKVEPQETVEEVKVDAVEKVEPQETVEEVKVDVVEKVEPQETVKEIKTETPVVSDAVSSEKKEEAPVSSKDPRKANQAIKNYGSSEMMEKVISINRITKVTKGGKKLSFSALVVVGDTKGNVGYSLSKASEVAIAIKKAMVVAKKNLIKVPMQGTTITHEIIGQCSGARVLLKPACDGTGVIASGPVRAVCDGAGIHNILTKCHRSNNPINVVKATIDGLSRLKSRK